jgi:crotonobetaine/carnitine-CoA ligase
VVQPRWSTSRFWDVSLKHRCTWTSMVWFCLRALEKAEAPDRHFYRLWGNAMCSPPSDERFGVKTIGWWGMTETMSHGIVGDVHLPNRSLTIGKPAPEYGIAILRDDGSPVEPGETGHLRVLGVPGLSLFKEYLNNGFITFADRDKDMLKVGGENVAASEIERVIVELPAAREVAVVAKRHEMLDEVPVAFVLVEGGVDKAPPDLAEQIIAACRDKLADFKVPREVHLVDELPRSTLEKIAKAELRKRLTE